MGEEYLFFAGMAKLGARFAFSWRPALRCGHGVNVFEKSGWGTPGFLNRLFEELTFRQYAARAWPLNAAQRRCARYQKAELRQTFAAALPGYLLRGQFSCLGDLARFSGRDPLFLVLLPYLLFGAVWRKLLTSRRPTFDPSDRQSEPDAQSRA